MIRKKKNKKPIIRGSKLSSKGLDSSKQGFVLASISQRCKFSSIIKSYPKISKHNFL